MEGSGLGRLVGEFRQLRDAALFAGVQSRTARERAERAVEDARRLRQTAQRLRRRQASNSFRTAD